MKKVCFIIAGHGYSGAEIVLERYINNNEFIKPYFIIIYENKYVENLLKNSYGADRVYCLRINYNFNKLRFLPYLEAHKVSHKAEKVIKEIKPEVIYANNTLETMLVVGTYLKKYDIPIIGHIHDMKKITKSPFRIRCIEGAVKKLDRLITVSKACKDDWDMNMEVVYNGLEEDYFNYSARNRIYNIAFVGSLSYRKGIDIFINAVKSIIDKNIVINVVYNNCENNTFIDELNNLYMIYPQKIKIYNNLPQNEIKYFYDQMDLVVVPSRNDPLPTVIMEAVARGTLVIGADVDGIPELLNYNEKLLFSQQDVLSLEYKLKEILSLDMNEYNKFTQCLYEYAVTNFNDGIKKKKINCIINSV